MKVSFNTINEVIVFHVHKTTVENLTKYEAISQTPIILWCNGILFNVQTVSNDQIFLKQSEGIEYIDTLTWCNSEKLDKSTWNGYAVEVQDVSNHPLFEAITKGLKK